MFIHDQIPEEVHAYSRSFWRAHIFHVWNDVIVEEEEDFFFFYCAA